MTATLPGMMRVRLLILFARSNSSKNFLTEVEENLPAAHAVRTDMPDASVMSRLMGTLDRLELAGDQEVGQREVDRQAAGIVGRWRR